MLRRNRRNKRTGPLKYESPPNADILAAYLHKNAARNRGEMRRIKRALRRSVIMKTSMK